MLKVLLIFLVFVSLYVWEASNLLRTKEIKELAVFSFLMIIGLALSLFMVIRSFI
jgi:hypothetical protein